MVNFRQPRDIAQVLLSVLFLAIMIVACLWIVQPFILGFAWAGTVVIATWPILLRLQKLLWGRRSLAVLVMTLLLVLLFIIPIALLVNSIVDGSGPLIHAVTAGDMTLPDLAWLNSIPLVGAKMYAAWHSLLDMGGSAIMAKVRPYIGTTTTWFVGQAAHIGRFMMHCGLMLLFSALLAYPLSKAELYGGKAINKFIIFTMYFSGGMIPNYILMVSLGLRDTVASFILPGMISTYYVILMRSFFLTLPRELEEAGEIDGLDLWGVFWRIAIPLSKPIIATMTLFYVVQYWNDWFDAFLYLDTTTKWPVAYYLRQLISSASGTSADAGDAMQIASNIKSCAMVLTSAPIICIYPFIQKYFVQGMMLGGVKG